MPGSYSFDLQVQSNDTLRSPYIITVSGTATAPLGNFPGHSGTYSGNNGCGIGSFTLTVGTQIVVTNFGSNPSTIFTLTANPNVCTASSLVIFGVAGHTCTLTLTGFFTLALHCSNTMSGQCDEAFSTP